jgi:hypothetical protein
LGNLTNGDLALGDVITLTFSDNREGAVRATVRKVLTDEQQGFSPEVEDYVACSLEIEPLDGSISQVVMLGTDFRYTLDGREVTIIKEG